MRNEKITPLYERLSRTMSYRREQLHIQPKTDVRGFCPPEWAAQPYALYR